jgi:hypothetical protein
MRNGKRPLEAVDAFEQHLRVGADRRARRRTAARRSVVERRKCVSSTMRQLDAGCARERLGKPLGQAAPSPSER